MNEALRAAGVDAARQSSPLDWGEVQPFLAQLGFPLVVKPRRGQAGVMVGIARSEAEARAMYESIVGERVSLELGGSTAVGSAVLQELLGGDEWVVDSVSRDGQHKVLALWRYERGRANGAPFVSFCDELMPYAGAAAESLVRYASEVLDALEWRWGACHMEVKLTSAGPRLVEINAGRWNCVAFKPLVDACVGRNAYDVAVIALAGGSDAWVAIPATPPAKLRAAGRLVKLVSPADGTLRRLRHQRRLRRLPSLIVSRPPCSRPLPANAHHLGVRRDTGAHYRDTAPSTPSTHRSASLSRVSPVGRWKGRSTWTPPRGTRSYCTPTLRWWLETMRCCAGCSPRSLRCSETRAPAH
eukprot:4352605-Prymnesium_polylepis.1